MDSAPIPLDTLLAHREWVRCVARAVVRDPNAADDVEQETWLAALRGPPRSASSLRGWLGAVTRSRARRIGRTETRREAREAAVARGGTAPSAGELAEIADTHRRVVQAVVELDEPYRETILLRYFEGLSIEDVAARTASPVETARSRIKRGVAKLRERLSRELATERRPWHVALVPLIEGTKGSKAAGAVAAAAEGVAMASVSKAALVASAVLVLAAGGVVFAIRSKPDGSTVAKSPDADAVAPAPKPAPEKAASAPPRAQRARAAEPEPAPAEAPKPPMSDDEVRRKLEATKLRVDWSEEPMDDVFLELSDRADVEIVFASDAADLVRSNGPLERLQLDQPVAAQQVLDLVTMLRGFTWTIGKGRVVIAPAGVAWDDTLPLVAPVRSPPKEPVTVSGRVTNANGDPFSGANVVQSWSQSTVALTDAAGHFEVALRRPYGAIEARADGVVPSRRATITGKPGERVTIDLTLGGPAGSVVVRVVGDAGPVAGATVQVETPPAVAPVQRKDDERNLTEGPGPRDDVTDTEGRATFDGIAVGEARISVNAGGFEPATATAAVTLRDRAEIEVRLVRKPSLKERLAAKRVSAKFREARVGEMVAFFRDSCQLSLILDPAFERRPSEIRTTLTLDDVPLTDALREICNALGGATYEIDEANDIVMIRPEKR